MKKIYTTLRTWLVAAIAFSIVSCSDWLDVHPRSQVEDSELLKTENGFKEALAGVYSSMVSDNTYTKEMLFGTIGVLGHEWTNYPSATYIDMEQFDYESSTSQDLIDKIWSTSYKSIAFANNIINQIDNNPQIFSNNNYSIIKGEALALRAYLHFDLLRCFGVSYAQNPDMPAIPYCDELTQKVFPQLTVSQVAKRIEEDLLAAEKLLVHDPIKTGETITEMNDNGYLINREVHLNYYAVKGVLARLYMWTRQYDLAKTYAEEIVNSNAFIWANGDEMSKGYDYSFVTEQLFALNNLKLSTLADTYFSEDNNSQSFSLSSKTLLDYFDNNTDDYRYLYQYQNGLESEHVDYRYLLKFHPSKIENENSPSATTKPASYYSNKIPLIRLSEMYLILSECAYIESGNGLTPLNELRKARNLLPLENMPFDFYSELIKEYRREFIGEGQLFFLYKRLNSDRIIGSDADVIVNKAYTFPLPISETDASQRNNNR